MFSVIALGTRFLLKGRVDRIRRRFELATIVGSVLVIWFVLYFISGLLLTYMRNTLSGDVVAIIYNLLAFGLIAFSMEYIRHGVIMLAGRRNAVWFGLLVALIFALPAVNLFGLMTVTSLEDFYSLICVGFCARFDDEFGADLFSCYVRPAISVGVAARHGCYHDFTANYPTI